VHFLAYCLHSRNEILLALLDVINVRKMAGNFLYLIKIFPTYTNVGLQAKLFKADGTSELFSYCHQKSVHLCLVFVQIMWTFSHLS